MKKVITLLAATLIAASAMAQYPYIDADGSTKTTTGTVTPYSGETTLGTAEQTTWYIVNGTQTPTGRINVNGDVHIILADNSHLDAGSDKGIRVVSGNSLTIYAQSTDVNAGKLTAESGNAGIGGNNGNIFAGSPKGEDCGNVTINGGVVTAIGGGAGIGGGAHDTYGGAGGNVIINGGVVTATGGRGIGGGGGFLGSGSGTLTINGGVVFASSVHPTGGAFEATGGILVTKNDFSTHWYGSNTFTVNGLVTVPVGYTFTIPAGKTLINNGRVIRIGSIVFGAPSYGEWEGTAYEWAEPPLNNVPYINEFGVPASADNVVEYRAGTALTSGWYIVKGTLTSANRVETSGDVYLILEDGSHLNATNGGVNVREGFSLTVYAQSTAVSTMGSLTARGGNQQAGIGGGGNVTINGGTVTASSQSEGAGIGGNYAGAGGNITINGGTVTATGGGGTWGPGGAGIGGGATSNAGNIIINGGTVNAQGNSGGAGIGAGGLSSGGTLAMSGNAVVLASSVSDMDATRKTGGILFIGNNGTAYGGSLSQDMTIDAGKTLTVYDGRTFTIPNSHTLTIASSHTLTNNGTIANSGTITNSGTINCSTGNISGTLTGNRANYTAAVFPTGATLTYGQTLSQALFAGNSGAGTFAFTAGTTVPTVAESGTAYEVAFTLSNNAANYNAVAPQNVQVSVNAASITDAAITLTAPVVAETPNIFATGTGDFTVSAVTWSPNDNPFKAEEAYTAEVTLTAEPNYTFTGISAGTNLTVNGNNATIVGTPGNMLTISWEFTAMPKITVAISSLMEENGEYNGAGHSGVTGTATSGAYAGALEYTYTGRNSTTYDPTATEPVNAGDYTVTVSVPDGDDFYEGSETYSFSIAKKPLVSTMIAAITPNPTYSGSAIEPQLTVEDTGLSGNIITTADYDVSYSANISAGTATATITATATGNYSGTADRTFTIDKATPADTGLSFTIPTDHVYNGAAQGIGSVTAASGINGLGVITVLYNGSPTPPVNAGTYTVTADIDASGGNYEAATGLPLGSYTIERATVTVKANDVTLTQGDPLPTPTVTYSGFFSPDDAASALATQAAARFNVSGSNTVGTSVIDFAANAVLHTGTHSDNYTLNHVNGTLTVNPPPQTVFDIHIAASAGGSVTADRTSAETGETVTLTVTPAVGYELVSLTADGVTLYGSGDTRTFTMPARDVTVTAVFRQMSYQSAWAAAKELIQNATFSILQHEIDASSLAATESALRYRLAALVNELIKQTGFTVSPSDIVILSGFVPPMAGDADNPDGTDGTFRFRVSPPDTNTSAYSSGTITASPVANDVIASPPRLRAWTLNGTLYISGLQPGATLQVYNVLGTLIYTTPNPSTGGELSISLPQRGVYVIVSGDSVVKVSN